MIIAFFLYEAFKLEVCRPIVNASAYATTVSRKLIDVAAKVLRHSEKIILKVTEATFKTLKFSQLWQKGSALPRFVWQ